MSRDYLGDILVIESECWQGRIIRPFTGSYNHLAMRTHPNQAVALSNEGLEKYLLSEIPEEWNGFVMLRHKTLLDFERDKLKRWNRQLSDKYDFNLLLKLAWRQIKGIEPNDEDLSGKGFDCSSRPARMYEMLGYPIIDGIDSSQIRPVHYLESPYFERLKEWQKKDLKQK